MAKRYFELTDAKSSKFWEIDVSGKKITVRYGKIGTDGQSTVKELATPAEAKVQADKLVLEKTKKGYLLEETLAPQAFWPQETSKEANVKAAYTPLQKKKVKKYTKKIYVKTEPGGGLVFGKLDAHFERLMKASIKNREMDSSILDLKFNDNFQYFEGTVNTGKAGEKGNVGKIFLDEEGPIALPEDKQGNLIDGFYLVWLSLSKVSIEFEFDTNDNLPFDENKLDERSLEIKLPKCISHDTYGALDFNIVTGYFYNGICIDNFHDAELVDRGYDSTFFILRVKKSETLLVFKCVDGEEEWFS